MSGPCDIGCECEGCTPASGSPVDHAKAHGWEEGRKDDSDKVRMELLSIPALNGTARVLTFGANKYADRNWEKGIDYSRVYGAMLRHMTAWWGGEDHDPETGESHLNHAACCVMFLQHFVETGDYAGRDNRPRGDRDGQGE